MKKIDSAKSQLIGSMIIFGTIGLFRRYIPFSSGTIAMFRAIIGVVYLLIFQLAFKKQPLNMPSIRKNLSLLICSSLAMAANWIFLFEAYRYTTVAVATVCYYMAPIFMIAVSPFLLKEKLGVRQLICIFVALIGIIFVSGVVESGLSGITGIILGLTAALLYAVCILLNQKMRGISGIDRTIAQLAIAAAALAVYVLFFEPKEPAAVSALSVIMLLVVGVIHTGIAYGMYFSSIQFVPTQTVAILSYIDPVVAIILSALILREKMSVLTWIGVVLVLAATAADELLPILFKKRK